MNRRIESRCIFRDFRQVTLIVPCLHFCRRRRKLISSLLSINSISSPPPPPPSPAPSSSLTSFFHCGTSACSPHISPLLVDPVRHGQHRQREGGHAADGRSRQEGQSVRVLPRRDVRVNYVRHCQCLPLSPPSHLSMGICAQGQLKPSSIVNGISNIGDFLGFVALSHPAFCILSAFSSFGSVGLCRRC